MSRGIVEIHAAIKAGLEPAAVNAPQPSLEIRATISAAISLKRIADSLADIRTIMATPPISAAERIPDGTESPSVPFDDKDIPF